MTDLTFLDTAVFVASFNEIDVRRRGVARGLIREALQLQRMVISEQVIAEFCREARQRFDLPMPSVRLHDYLRVVLVPLCRARQPGPAGWHDCLDLADRWDLPLADAAIVSTAIQHGCRRLLTDRPYAGRRFGPLQCEDPFRLH